MCNPASFIDLKMHKTELSLVRIATLLTVIVFFGVFAMLSSGCQEQGFYIGNGCNDNEIRLISIGIDRANDAFGAEIKIAGMREDDYYYQDAKDSIYCIHDDGYTIRYTDGVIVGHMDTDDIVVFSHLISSDDRWLSVFMHELGHYMGLSDVDDEDDIMNWKVTKPPITEY